MNPRIPSSLDRVQGDTVTSESALRAMIARAGRRGVRAFLKSDLARLPWHLQELIERERQRLYGSAQ